MRPDNAKSGTEKQNQNQKNKTEEINTMSHDLC